MIDFVDAITHAKDYFAKSNEVILDCKETEDSWIFSGGIEGKRKFGINAIEIDKANGNIHLFRLPNKKNFEKLEKSRTIDFLKQVESKVYEKLDE